MGDGKDEGARVSIEWRQEPTRYVYWYGTTPTRFSFQIGESTNHGRFVALVFHDDFRFLVYAEETASVPEAQEACARWLAENARLVDAAPADPVAERSPQ